MRHLQEDEIVSLVFDEIDSAGRRVCLDHLEACDDCARTCQSVRSAVGLLERQPLEPAPAFAWARLERRIRAKGPEEQWEEPAWIPLVLGHALGILVLIGVFVALGSWLETVPVWRWLGSWPVAREFGGRGVVALAFFGFGTLTTLAMAPVLWWESRRARSLPIE